jgi:hypothetical protein
MDRCCMHSFVTKGFREGFKLANFGDRHRCETCGQVYVLERADEKRNGVIGPNEFEVTDGGRTVHYTWQPLRH